MPRKYSNLESYQVLSDIRALALQEQSLIVDLLEYLYEVDVRKLYAPLAYSSLFEFGVKELGFTRAQSYERTRAVAAMKQIPEVRERIRAGELSLTNAALLKRAIDAEERALGSKVDAHFKAALVAAALGATKREFQGKLDEVLTSPESRAAMRERVLHRSATRTALQFEIDVATETKMKRARELVDAPTLEELFDRALDSLIEAEEVKRRYRSGGGKKNDRDRRIEEKEDGTLVAPSHDLVAGHHEGPESSTKEIPIKQKSLVSRYIPAKYRMLIAKRSGAQCEYIDPGTMRRCSSRSHLQIDHKMPLAMGGTTTLENLRHLCGTHNRLEAVNARLGINLKG
jgi:hypothetical protein